MHPTTTSKWIRPLLLRWPLARAAALHRAGLAAMGEGDFAAAAPLFEKAGLAYRRELDVEALARLRVHALMASCLADPHRGHAAAVEVERRLARLERIEALVAPFEFVSAHEMMARWNAAAPPAECDEALRAA